jgi:Holliday junction resolvasome RuvABC endonuclease subunit
MQESPRNSGWVVGIDPSLTSTGVCFYPVNLDGETLETLVFGSEPAPTLAGRFNRYRRLCEKIEMAIDNHEVLLVVIEGYSLGSHTKGVTDRVEFGGMLRDRLLPEDLLSESLKPSIVEIEPTRLKKFVTGKGTGDKAAMISCIVSRWPVPVMLKEDEYEAIALAKLGASLIGAEQPVWKFQEEVIADILNPQPKKTKRKAKAS